MKKYWRSLHHQDRLSNKLLALFGEASNPLAKLLKKQFLGLSKVVVEQDANILSKIYTDAPQKIKLNNEVGMDWVNKNFARWEHLVRTANSIY